MVREAVANIAQDCDGVIEVEPFDNLLVDYAASADASVLIRGLRAVSDFEYEFQMSSMNNRLAPEIETVFLMATDQNQFISSRLVKEVAALGGDISHFVSPRVAKMVREKLA
jgi:pantetheine-phosphate adenylyltransferase